MKKVILDTPLGKIRGVETEEGIQRFAGIRYASVLSESGILAGNG